jgi:type IV pilus assembly protein PilC
MKYQYRAIKQGQIVKGDIEAKNKEKAIEVLKSNKIVILDVKPKKNPIFSSDALFNRVSFNEIVNLTRHFSIMLNAGLTITDSIDIIKKQSESKGMEKLINMIEDEIRSGNSLSTALEAHTNYFSNFYIRHICSKIRNIVSTLAKQVKLFWFKFFQPFKHGSFNRCSFTNASIM